MCGRCLRCWGQGFAAAWPHFLLERALWGHRADTGKSSEPSSPCSKKDEALGTRLGTNQKLVVFTGLSFSGY